jgi:PAS domain S-box-containing protein
MSKRYAYLMLFLLMSQGLLLLWPETPSAFRWAVLIVSWCAGALLVLPAAWRPSRGRTLSLPGLDWMVQRIPCAFFAMNRTQQLIYMNDSGQQLLEELTGLKALVGQDVHEMLRTAGYTSEEIPITTALQQAVAINKVKLHTAAGRVFHVSAAPIMDPVSGDIVGAAAYLEDITEDERLYRQAEEWSQKYQAQSAMLKTLLNSLPLSVMAVDSQGRITVINDEAATYFPQWKKDELIGMDVNELYRLNGNPPEEVKLSRSLRGETYHEVQSTYKGMTFVVHTYPLYSLDGSAITGAVGIYQDITEWERLKKEWSERERLNLVGQLAAGITHEIRNPLAVMRGFLQVLREKSEAKQQHYFDIILSELDRANNIITDYLSLARQDDTEVIEKQQLNTLIESLTPLLSADANLKGMTLRLSLEEGLPELPLHVKEMKQLILNLASNGMDAMKEGGILTIATSRREDGIEMRIADTGAGMDEQQLSRIFEPFYTTKPTGTGLGLATCLAIAERRRFQIRVDSEPGGGTTFTCRFHLEPSPSAELKRPVHLR